MKILCFGDSNTYGFIPGEGGRYDRKTRWTGRLKMLLGENCRIMEDGLNGRTTVFEEELCPGRCGLDDIGAAVELSEPLDLLILMLGTNDCKNLFSASAEDIAKGIETVLKKALDTSDKPFQTLLIAPAPLTERVSKGSFWPEFDENSRLRSEALAGEYRKVAEKFHCEFLDAGTVTKVSDVDGVHLDEEGHKALAEAVAGRIRKQTINSAIRKLENEDIQVRL